ncbi:LOW QUALITY PROTEIN: CBL-interacting protein kinase 17-like [Lolium rigidum]|uniref:LOW QUALITY PROTEIN: CBL-interacting protein kinase 17-like n=1 Tax=Lolium rigidum TaxID=89674 RepID=UPI001F5D501C|nr:LOW QUALITY PROTEIN: CBL-interacting protein kinase 17-like [Lolium rigidum]
MAGDDEGCRARAALLGAYQLGRTLGEGSFGKVKHARRRATGEHFAVKILERGRVLSRSGADDQVRREIATLTMLRHPNVVRLHEVAASKTKIYMVLEFVNGGELFDRIAMKRKLPEPEGRRLFQQLIDGVSYCHGKGVYHRDLKPENVLVDKKGNIKISDFGLSALPQQLGGDGLLHTTCGSPNYIAPEVLQNRGYDGSLSDIWSCGVILYIMLVGYLPFDDRNMVVLYQKIFKGDAYIPEWLSPGAQDLLRRILKPDPKKRINMAEIKTHEWFQKDYIPVAPYDDNDEDVQLGAILPVKEKQISEAPGDKNIYQMNAFELIGMSSSLDLSSLFEEEEVSQRKIRFTSVLPPKDLFDKMESSATVSGFQVQRVHSKLKIMRNCNRLNNPTPFLVCAEVFALGPSLHVVELKKSHGDSELYRQLCDRISSDLGIGSIFGQSRYSGKTSQALTVEPQLLWLPCDECCAPH